MAASQATEAYRGTSAHPDCDPEIRLYLDGAEVPVVNITDNDLPAVETRIRNEGEASISRVSKVFVPLDWFGKEIEPVTRILDGQPDSAPNARLELKNVAGDPRTIHDGYVGAIGLAEADAVNIRISDYSDFFTSVGFGESYNFVTGSPTPENILIDAIAAVTDNTESIGDIPLVTDVQEFRSGIAKKLTEEPVPGQIQIQDVLSDPELSLFSRVSFTRNRDTAADALKWVCERTDSEWWLDYNDERGRRELYVDTAPRNPLFTDVRLEEDDEGVEKVGRPIVVRDNNAAFELSPAHTLQGVGEGSWKERLMAGGDAPIATVQHDGLVEFVGANTQPPRQEFGTQTVEATKYKTVSALRDQIEDAAGGEMVVEPEPDVLPHNVVTAKPTCDGNIVGDLPPLTYQVNEVIHHIEVNDAVSADQPPPATVLRCSIKTERGDFSTVEPTGTIEK